MTLEMIIIFVGIPQLQHPSCHLTRQNTANVVKQLEIGAVKRRCQHGGVSLI